LIIVERNREENLLFGTTTLITIKMRRHTSEENRQVCSLLILVVLSFASAFPIMSSSSQSVMYYADVIKYPLPSIPEALLDGGTFIVQVKLESSTVWQNATVYTELATATATLLNSNYNTQTGIWSLAFDLPTGLREGVYNLDLKYKPTKTDPAMTLTQPRCLWILQKWPQKLRILVCGDILPSIGYWEEMVKEANLLDPHVILFQGDLVDVPILASEWIALEKSLNAFIDPTFTTVGNHEYTQTGKADLYNRIMGPVNYSATVGNFLFLSLDTDSDGWVRMNRLQWAEQVLDANLNKTKIIVFHHPLFNEMKLKTLGKSWFNITSWHDFSQLLNNGFIYPTWAARPEEARELFRLIVEHDVRLILSGHIHTDLNVIISETTTGRKHYFITSVALDNDIPDHDYRGYRLIDLYVNGTVVESTLYYNGTGMFKYPNSIPIDKGTTVNYKPVEPYKIGFLEYYYTPANDGKHSAVSFMVKNELNQRLDNPRIIFKLPANIPLDRYKWHPYKPAYEAIERDRVHYVILKNITISAYSTLSFTVESVDDAENPKLSLMGVPKNVEPASWICFNAKARDQGWGIKEIILSYSVDGKIWIVPDLLDLQSAEDGNITYGVWIRAPNLNTTLTIKAKARDFAGHESIETMETVIVGTPPPPKYTLNVNSSPVTGVSFTLNGQSKTTQYSAALETGKYTVTVPTEVTVAGSTYAFVRWGDGSTDSTKTIDLKGDVTLTANYEVKAGMPLWQISAIAAVVIAVVAVILLRMRKII